jgi:O-antigen/teichoic acid export membrane protein
LRKKYFYNLLLTVFSLLIPVINFPYVTRVLGPEGLGKAQFVITFCQYISLLAALGIPIYGIREVARVKHSKESLSRTFIELLLINLLTCVFCFAVFLIIILQLPYFRGDRQMFIYSSVLILLGFSSIDWLYTGLEAFKLMALRSIAIKIAGVALTFILVRQKQDAGIFLMINVVSILANNAVNLWYIRDKIDWHIQGIALKQHLRPLFFIFGTTIASTLYTTFDTVILGLLSGDQAVGLYTAATKLTKIAIPVITALGGTLVGEITRNMVEARSADLDTVLNRSYTYIVLLGVPVSVILFAFAPPLIQLFSGTAFQRAVVTMRIMAFLPILIGLGYFWGYQVILPMGKEKYLMYAAVIGMLTSLTLNLSLTPAMRENGAAIANAASELIVTASYFMFIRRYMTVRIRRHYLLQAVIASVPFLLFLCLPTDYAWHSLTLTLAINIMLGGSAYLLLQIFAFKNAIVLHYLTQLKLTWSGR